MAPKTNSTDAALKELRAFGLDYPGAHTKSPWPGHLDLAVNDKTFAYLSVEGDPFHISCKLPHSAEEALSLPFVTPAAYGLAKSGWVNAELPNGPVPLELFQAWIDESYRAQAPKRLLASLPETFEEVVRTRRASEPRATPPLTKRAILATRATPPAKKTAAAKSSVATRRAAKTRATPAAKKRAAAKTRATPAAKKRAAAKPRATPAKRRSAAVR
jgi:predicted DNA-binding protein (MmcQ/YjbR family)